MAVVAAEVLLLALLWRSGDAWFPLALALSPVFFLITFRSPDTAWALVWIAVPFSIATTLPGGNAIQFPTEPMIALALMAWCVRWMMSPVGKISPSPMHVPLAALAAVALLSALAGSHPWIGVKAWITAAGYAAFGYLYFASQRCDSERRERWIRLAVATGAVWGLYGAVRVLLLGAAQRTAYGVGRPFFPEHGSYSAYVAMLLPLALLAALDERGRGRPWYAVAASLMALGCLLSFTRAAWVSLALVLPIMIVVWVGKSRSVRPVLVTASMVLLVGIVIHRSGVLEPLTRHAGSIVDTSNVSNLERLNRWVAAIEMAKDRPLLGVGYSAFGETYPRYRRKLIVTELAYVRMGPHSEPMRILSETGVMGMAAALWLLAAAGAAGARVVRHGDRRDGLLALAALSCLATYLVHGVFNTYLAIDKVAVPFWMGLGTIAGLHRKVLAK
jgi:O-antigen ligase